MRKLKRLLALTLVITAVATTSVAAEIKKVKVGEQIVVKLPSPDVTMMSLDYPDSSLGKVEVGNKKDKLYVHGIQSGKVNVQVSGSKSLSVYEFEVIGKKQKNKQYNNLMSVVDRIEGDGFVYTDAYISYKPGDDVLYFHANLKNTKSYETKPDCRIIFYDKNKKELSTYVDSQDDGHSWNITVLPNESYPGFEAGIGYTSLDLTRKEFKQIKYWRAL